MTRYLILAVFVFLSVAGCVGQKEGEEAAKAEEFNQANYEKAMIEQGKGEELAEAKKREEAYLAAQGGDTGEKDQR